MQVFRQPAEPAIDYAGPVQPAMLARDLERLVDFYVTVLGFTHQGTAEVPPGIASRTSISKTGYRIARLQNPVGDTIKLVATTGVETQRGEKSQVLERKGDGYLTFIVRDLGAVLQRLSYHGARITSDGIVNVRPGIFLVFAEDPEGNAIEFVEIVSG